MIKKFSGSVTAPVDMMAAAKASLAEFPGAFEDLMEQTKGAPPTADQLCTFVDGCRQAKFVADTNDIMPSVSMQIAGSVDPKSLN